MMSGPKSVEIGVLLNKARPEVWKLGRRGASLSGNGKSVAKLAWSLPKKKPTSLSGPPRNGPAKTSLGIGLGVGLSVTVPLANTEFKVPMAKWILERGVRTQKNPLFQNNRPCWGRRRSHCTSKVTVVEPLLSFPESSPNVTFYERPPICAETESAKPFGREKFSGTAMARARWQAGREYTRGLT
jgi:hypothetical protein